MIGILVWDRSKGRYVRHLWRVKFNAPVTGEVDEESYWLPHWGVNPFIASKGYFDPESN